MDVPSEGDTFARVCARLGMAPEAACGRTRLYSNPHVVCTLNLTASFTAHAVIGVAYTVGYEDFYPLVHVPVLLFLLATATNFVGMWRWGPFFAATVVSRCGKLFGIVNIMFVAGTSFIGPVRICPFGSRLAATLVLSCGGVGLNIAAKFGSVPADHPQHRQASITQPLIQAIISAARTVDSITDMAIIGDIVNGAFTAKRCFWYGGRVPCGRFAVLGCVAAVFLLTDLFITVALILHGSWLRQHASRRLLCMHVTGLICEVGMVTVALLSVLSNAKHPELRTRNATSIRMTILLASLSCMFSTLTCWLSIRGFEQVLLTLHRLPQARPIRGSISTVTSTASRLRHMSLKHVSGSCRVEPECAASSQGPERSTCRMWFPEVQPQLQHRLGHEQTGGMSDADTAWHMATRHGTSPDTTTPHTLAPDTCTGPGVILQSESRLEQLCVEGSQLCESVDTGIPGTYRPTHGTLEPVAKSGSGNGQCEGSD